MSAAALPYFEKADFKYDVKYTNAEGLKSLELYSVDNKMAGKWDSIQWVFIEYKTTYLDQAYCIQDSHTVMITSPKRGVFAATENVPNPQIKYPPTIGDSIYVEQPISNGKTMKGYLKVTETLKHGKNTNNNNAWKIVAYNLDDVNYSAIYYYNELNGFVYLKYKLDDKAIEMDLTTIIYHVF